MLLRNYKFRIYPSKSQRQTLETTLELCRRLYNCALEQRIDAWKRRKRSLTFFDQAKELRPMKQIFTEYKAVYAQVLLTPLDQLDKAYKSFFRRIKRGQTPGFPRFKGFDRFDSFAYPQQGFSVDEENQRINLSKIGSIKIKQWRRLPNPPKRVVVKREADGWYVVLCCPVEPTELPKTGKSIGIDVGLSSLVTLSDGRKLGSLSELKADEKKIRRWQRQLSRKRKGSSRRRHARAALAKKHQQLARRRSHQLHQISRQLIRENDLLALEDLQIKQLASKKQKTDQLTTVQQRGIRRNIHQAAWAQLRAQIVYKAEEAGRTVAVVDPRGTSQECSACGQRVPKRLSQRIHSCPHCGLEIDRDHNAAINILQRVLRIRRGGLCSKGGPLKREDRPRESCQSAGASTP
jgi:putative transposase